MNFLKKGMPIVFGLFLIAVTAFGQAQQGQSGQVSSEDITDEELEQFSDIAMESQKIQREANQKLQQALNEYENMNIQRFQTIMMSKRSPQMADSIEVTEEEQDTMDELQPQMAEINQKAQKDVMAAIQESTLTQQRLQAIQQAIQGDQDLQKRFREVMMKKQKEAAAENDSSS